MYWVMSQVHLKHIPCHTCFKGLEWNIISHLRFHHGQHSITNTHYWEMLTYFIIMCLCPKKDSSDCFSIHHVFSTADESLRISWNIQPIKVFKFCLYYFMIQSIIYWYNSSPSTFQKLNMTCFYKLSIDCSIMQCFR